jgi:hypothetical protein
MPVGIRLGGIPGSSSSLPNSARPGDSAPPSGPIQDRIQRDAQADSMWSNTVMPGGVQNILATKPHAISRQLAVPWAMAHPG